MSKHWVIFSVLGFAVQATLLVSALLQLGVGL